MSRFHPGSSVGSSKPLCRRGPSRRGRLVEPPSGRPRRAESAENPGPVAPSSSRNPAVHQTGASPPRRVPERVDSLTESRVVQGALEYLETRRGFWRFCRVITPATSSSRASPGSGRSSLILRALTVARPPTRGPKDRGLPPARGTSGDVVDTSARRRTVRFRARDPPPRSHPHAPGSRPDGSHAGKPSQTASGTSDSRSEAPA